MKNWLKPENKQTKLSLSKSVKRSLVMTGHGFTFGVHCILSILIHESIGLKESYILLQEIGKLANDMVTAFLNVSTEMVHRPF